MRRTEQRKWPFKVWILFYSRKPPSFSGNSGGEAVNSSFETDTGERRVHTLTEQTGFYLLIFSPLIYLSDKHTFALFFFLFFIKCYLWFITTYYSMFLLLFMLDNITIWSPIKFLIDKSCCKEWFGFFAVWSPSCDLKVTGSVPIMPICHRVLKQDT